MFKGVDVLGEQLRYFLPLLDALGVAGTQVMVVLLQLLVALRDVARRIQLQLQLLHLLLQSINSIKVRTFFSHKDSSDAIQLIDKKGEQLMHQAACEWKQLDKPDQTLLVVSGKLMLRNLRYQLY